MLAGLASLRWNFLSL